MNKIKAVMQIRITYYQGFDQCVPLEVQSRLHNIFTDESRLALRRKLKQVKFIWSEDKTALTVGVVWAVVDQDEALQILSNWLRIKVWNIASSVYGVETTDVQFTKL